MCEHCGWAEGFLVAGMTASLLVAVNLLPAVWWTSFFLLIPFLAGTVNARTGEATRMGLLLGLCCAGVSLSAVFRVDPSHGAIRLILTAIPFILFVWMVGWSRQRWVHNTLVVAFLWVGLELILVGMRTKYRLLDEAANSQRILGEVGVLPGAVCVSVFVVLVNSLPVQAIHKLMSRKGAETDSFWVGLIIWGAGFPSIPAANWIDLIQRPRGPPVVRPIRDRRETAASVRVHPFRNREV